MEYLIFYGAMLCSKQLLCDTYSPGFYRTFYKKSKDLLPKIMKEMPPIGKYSAFSATYVTAPVLIAWCKALTEMHASQRKIDPILWTLCEELLKTFPAFLRKWCGKAVYESFRKKAPLHVRLQQQGRLLPADWHIDFRQVSPHSFAMDVTECAFVKLAPQFGVEHMLPGICRIDFLMAHYFGMGFHRTKTLADGDDCCNCEYSFVGACPWAPETGFVRRK